MAQPQVLRFGLRYYRLRARLHITEAKNYLVIIFLIIFLVISLSPHSIERCPDISVQDAPLLLVVGHDLLEGHETVRDADHVHHSKDHPQAMVKHCTETDEL